MDTPPDLTGEIDIIPWNERAFYTHSASDLVEEKRPGQNQYMEEE
jgi:hypothetical protein